MYELTRKELIMTQERKPSFICPVCGREDLTASVIVLHGCYGSQHDTERATVKLCGDCFDRLYAVIQSNLPGDTMETEFVL